MLIAGVVIALLPLFNFSTFFDDQRGSRLFLGAIVCVFLMLLMGEKKRMAPWWIWGAVVLIFVHASFNWIDVFPGYTKNSPDLIIDLAKNKAMALRIGIFLKSIYIAIYSAFFVSFLERFDRTGVGYLADGLAIGCLLQSTLVLFKFLGIDIYTYFYEIIYPNSSLKLNIAPELANARGSLGNPNVLGSYLSIGIWTFLRGKWIYLTPIVLIALFLTNSVLSMAVIGAVLICFYFWEKINFKILIPSVTIAYFILAGFDPAGVFNGRSGILNAVFSKFSIETLVMGGGTGWLGLNRLLINDAWIAEEHSELVASVVAMGIIGALIYFSLFLKALHMSTRSTFSLVVLACFINSLGHFTFHLAPTLFVFITFLAVAIGRRDERHLEG